MYCGLVVLYIYHIGVKYINKLLCNAVKSSVAAFCNRLYKEDRKRSVFMADKKVETEKWKFLTTVANDIEFEMLSGLLATAEIPCVKKVRGADGYLQVLLGVPIAGIEVIVPPDRYEEALQLIESSADVDENEIDE